MYKIEKNIPLPGSRGKWQSLYEQMEVGDSVEVEGYNQAKSFVASIHNKGGKAVIRPTENGIRVWVVKRATK